MIAKVALLSPYAFNVKGGVQEQVVAMSRELGRRNVEVRVFAPNANDHSVVETSATVVREGRLFSLPANGSTAPLTLSWAASRKVFRDLTSFQPDVVHIHEPFAPVLAYSSLRHHSFPTVGTFHRSGGGPAYSLTSPLLRWLGRGLDAAVSVSAEAAQTLEQGCGLRSRELFNGFEVERFSEFERSRTKPPRVLFLGRLDRRKGILDLLEAERMNGSQQNWTLTVAGDGVLRGEVERRVADRHNVEVLGVVNDEHKRRLLRSSDVLVAPSTHGESFGLVLLEGLASGTMVVAADIPGYRLAGGEAVEYCPPGDPAMLHRTIGRALSLADEERLQAGYVRAVRWSMASLMDEYLEIYEQAIHRFKEAK